MSETTFPVYKIDQQACSEIFTEMNLNFVPKISLKKLKKLGIAWCSSTVTKEHLKLGYPYLLKHYYFSHIFIYIQIELIWDTCTGINPWTFCQRKLNVSVVNMTCLLKTSYFNVYMFLKKIYNYLYIYNIYISDQQNFSLKTKRNKTRNPNNCYFV